MRKNNKRWLAVLLAGSMICSGSVPAAAGASEAKQKKQQIQGEITEKKNQISSLETEKSNVSKKIQELDEQNQAAQDKLNSLNEQITEKEQDIEENQVKLTAAQEKEQVQYQDMKKRIQYLYENGSSSIAQIFLEAESITEVLNRAEYFSQMTSFDRKKLEDFKAVCQEISDIESALKNEKQELTEYKTEAEQEKASIEESLAAKQSEIQKFEESISDAEREQADLEGALEVQNQILAQIEAEEKAAAEKAAAEKAAEEKAAREAEEAAQKKASEEKASQTQQSENEEAQNSGSQDSYEEEPVQSSGSGFLWPCPAGGSISSPFGNRTSPTAGASSYHQGIDIPASSGSSIIAAASGTVTVATYSSSAGNYICIDHGNGLSTVYMHCSALYVSVGQRVSAGQSIAAVGSTGYSTGPHLHFGVMSGGSYVNPMNYL